MPHHWTPERRAAQAARIKESRPWTKSTGPRTKAGKKRSSRNAFKHGGRRAILEKGRKAVKLQQEFMQIARFLLKDPAVIDQILRANYKNLLASTRN